MKNDFMGIVRTLGELGSGAIVTEAGLAELFGKHPVSIRRAVKRGELPRPVRIMGAPSWTAGAIIQHVEARLERERREAERLARKINELSA